jgi:hypothetical protein
MSQATIEHPRTAGTANSEHQDACPPWCDVTDHDDWDGGETRHQVAWVVDHSALPYEVQGYRHYEHTNVILAQEPGHEPVIMIEPPPTEESRLREVPMTLAEAGEMAATIEALVDRARGTTAPGGPRLRRLAGWLHRGCAPRAEMEHDIALLGRALADALHELDRHGIQLVERTT